jgi:hypothetical protein
MAFAYVSKVGSSGAGDGQFSSLSDCEVDGSYIYTCDYGNKRIQIFDKGTLAYVAQHPVQTFGGNVGSPSSIAINDLYYYVGCNNATPFNGYIEKYDIATRSFQASYDTTVIADTMDLAWSCEVAKFVSAGIKYGDLWVLHQDGSYLDTWPICRFVDDIRLVEDGDLATGDYVGLRAPAAVTTSYSLTFPAALPAGQSHVSCSLAGVLSFGQDVNTTASPTFVRLTLSQATGTAPMTISSTTVVSNLNADLLDGKHETAFVLVDGTRALTADWDAGGYEIRSLTFESDVATGTAPFTIASTTLVTNLNADLLDGLHSTSFTQVYIAATASPAATDDINQTPTAFREGCIWVEQDSNAVWFCADNADGAAVWHGIDQDLRTTDSPTFAVGYFKNGVATNVEIDGTNGYIKAGSPDVTRGIYYAYGSAAGSVFGGSVFMSLADDHNAVISAYGLMPYEDDLYIGPDTNVDALKLASTDDLYITGGSLVLPASEYVNFGGTLGAGGYGIRDNAGTMQFCNSGGAWTAMGAGGGASAFLDLTDVPASYATHGGKFVKVNAAETALEFIASSVAGHDILSASHTDALASAVSRGSLIYGNDTPKWAELVKGNAGDVLTCDGTDVAWAAPSGGSSHVLLSATHTDTLADTVVRGDIIYGNSTPKWARLAKGTSGYVLTMGANEPSWVAIPAVKLDDAGAPDDNTDLDVSTSKHGLCPKAPNLTTQFLRGDATWAVPTGFPAITAVKSTEAETNNDKDALVDVSGFSFSITSGHYYRVFLHIVFQTTSTTIALRVGWSTYPTFTIGAWGYQAVYGSAGSSGEGQGSDAASFANILNTVQNGTANTDLHCYIWAWFLASSSTTLQFGFCPEADGTTITIQGGGLGIIEDYGVL